MNAVDTIKSEAGFYAELHYDQCPSNPREDDVHFLFLGLEHRHRKIGDETIKHDMDCPCCNGEGEIESTDTDGSDGMTMCDLCGGAGSAVGMTMLAAFIEYVFRPLHMRAVGMIDHSGVSFYLGGGASMFDPGGWDSGTAGFMLYLPTHKAMWGGDPTPEELDEQMRAELQEYTDYCNGHVYGVMTFDPNGDEVDSCWALVGDYAWEYAREELATYTAADIPEKLYAVPRMTRREINVIAHCLALFDGDAADAAESAFNKLATIERSE